jgi:hypothetical protein
MRYLFLILLLASCSTKKQIAKRDQTTETKIESVVETKTITKDTIISNSDQYEVEIIANSPKDTIVVDFGGTRQTFVNAERVVFRKKRSSLKSSQTQSIDQTQKTESETKIDDKVITKDIKRSNYGNWWIIVVVIVIILLIKNKVQRLIL